MEAVSFQTLIYILGFVGSIGYSIGQIRTLKENSVEIKQSLKDITRDIKDMNQDINALRLDVNDLKNQVNILKSDFDGLKNRVGTLEKSSIHNGIFLREQQIAFESLPLSKQPGKNSASKK